MKEFLTIDSQLCPGGVVGAKVIGDHTLIAPLISEINIEEMEFCGVDQFFVLVSGVVLHLCVVQHLPVLPPNYTHG